MAETEDVVQISDDDSSSEEAIIIENRSKSTNSLDDLETIIIDDESATPSNSNRVNEKKEPEYESNETMFRRFVEQCVELGYSKGFLRVISKNLMKAYTNADKQYLKSKEFERAVKNAADCLKDKPWYKFSLIKNLCEALESHPKKRQYSSAKENGRRIALKRKSTLKLRNGGKKPRSNMVINIDDDDDDNNERIEISDGDDEVLPTETDITHIEAEKENVAEQCDKSNHLEEVLEVEWDPNIANTSSNAVVQAPKIIKPKPPDANKVIKDIENKILHHKQRIIELEEQEVVDDSPNSPYIQAERYKQQIVKLYQQLCDLKGAQATKRREVRLKVLNDHPAGPVERLEKFINQNISSDGVPAFPDFSDVVKCVEEAAAHDPSMAGWSKARILQEANGLFTQCGQALQKKRQKREWKDLLKTVKMNSIDYDPADDDPALQAKLEANRKLALKREKEILQKFVIKQHNQNSNVSQLAQTLSGNQLGDATSGNHVVVQTSSVRANLNSSDDNSDDSDSEGNDENEDEQIIQHTKLDECELIDSLTKDSVDNNVQTNVTTNKCTDDDTINYTGEDVALSSKLITIHEKTVSIQEDTENEVMECIHANQGEESNLCVVENSENLNLNRNIDGKEQSSEKEILDYVQSEPDCVDKSEKNIETTGDSVVRVKTEKVDVAALLTELGDNFTASIFDIIDPFLVIEISSDSSDEDYL